MSLHAGWNWQYPEFRKLCPPACPHLFPCRKAEYGGAEQRTERVHEQVGQDKVRAGVLLTIKVPMPFRRREAKTASFCGFARLLCAKPAFLAGLCASSKLPTFIYGGAV